MTEAEILAAIEEVARTHVGFTGTLQPELRLVEDLKLDSLKALTLALEVENRFRICLDPEIEARVETVGELVGAVNHLMMRRER
jgi:acyl carrier protein